MEKQRERLVELLNEATFGVNKHTLADHLHKETIERVADYLIANNVVVLPMKLGQTCFATYSRMVDVDECRVSSLTQKADGTFKIRLTNLRGKFVFEITEDEIGKKVFLSREEAEAKLRETRDGT
jgi:hypothetical protein